MGGTGFVGRHIAARLNKMSIKTTILTRSIARHRDLLVLPNIELVETNVHDEEMLQVYFQETDVVINLVGILNEKGRDGSGFQKAHFELARKVLSACEKQGVGQLLHMSALHANVKGPSFYLESKGLAEDWLLKHSHNVKVSLFRPSVIFGAEDSFLNRFSSLLSMLPLVFPLACANARFAPVYVGDVADKFIESIGNKQAYSQAYNLCGPKEYTLKQLVAYVDKLQGSWHIIMGLNDLLSKMQAAVFEFIPGKPLSLDNYKSLQVDSICKNNQNKQMTSLETIAPTYIGNHHKRARYTAYQQNR